MAATSKPRKASKPTIKQAIGAAKPAEAVVSVCLRRDLAQAVTELEQQKLERLAESPESLAGPPDLSDLDAQIADLKVQQEEHTFSFRLRELSYRRWDQLEAAHPPLEGQKERLNLATFLPAVVRAAVVEPQLDDEDWDMLLGKRVEHAGDCKLHTATSNEDCTCQEPVLSKSQFGRLADAAVELSSSKDTTVPFSVLASMLRQISANG
jgi:hypothetical protein